jgi:heme/copper-type cytochrome/quinol oxidase subunit 3
MATFFFISFVFAYFYLRSLDSNKAWKIGKVSPSVGWGVAIVVVLLLSAVALRVAATRSQLTVRLGALAVVLVLLSIVLQVVQWTTLGFGPASGGYASVYVGWTAFYAVFTLPCAFWIETQVATAWRRSAEDIRGREPASPADVHTSPEVIKAGLDACSFFWSFYVFTGVVLFVLLYLL